MLADNLKQTISAIRTYQKICPETYNCIKGDLSCLIEHMELVAKYLDPVIDEDLAISLPKTVSEAKNRFSVKS